MTLKYSYDYPRLMLTTDCVVFSFTGKVLSVLLIERKYNPYFGKWAFPGGFLEMNETAEQGVLRELEEETGLNNIPCHQFHVFSKPERDPRGWTVTIAFLSLINKNNVTVKAGDDAAKAVWYNVNNLPALAFDHSDIFTKALEELKYKLTYPSQLQDDASKYFDKKDFLTILQLLL